MRAATFLRAALAATLGAFLLFAFAPAAHAQEEGGEQPPQMDEDEKRREFIRIFQLGLEALTNRDLERAEQIFKACVQLYPDRPVAYYNLACGYSLGGKVDEAVENIRAAYERGFNDLAHMHRDPDLDAIRREPAFRAAMGDFEEEVLSGAPEPLVHLPKAGDGLPLVVYLHGNGADPGEVMDRLRETLDGWAILVPQGPQKARGGVWWDDRAEWLTLHHTRGLLEREAKRIDAERVYVVGEGPAGQDIGAETSGAKAVAYLGHNPDVFAGALAAGPRLNGALGDLTFPDTRVYLVAPAEDDAAVDAAAEVRAALVAADSPVVLERYPSERPLANDRALLLRALRWLEGQQVKLPGAGAEVGF